MANNRHINAVESLPKDLIETLSKALGGSAAYIWIPSARTLNRMERDRYILDKYQQGYSQEEIADEIFLSIRTVYNIVAKERSRRRLVKRSSDQRSSSENAE